MYTVTWLADTILAPSAAEHLYGERTSIVSQLARRAVCH